MVAAYLGKPANPWGMQALPSPRLGWTGNPGRAEQVKSNAAGGTTVLRTVLSKRSWSLPYTNQQQAASDLIQAFYVGTFNEPSASPYVFVDPSMRNVLGLESSTTGGNTQLALGWLGSAGTVAASTAVTPPVPGAGVLAWSSPGTSAVLAPGVTPSTATVANPLAAPVQLDPEWHCGSLYLAAASATTVTLQLVGYTATGAALGSPVTQSCAVTTSMQRFSVVAAGTSLPATWVFVRPVVVTASSGTIPTVYVSAGQFEYASSPSTWQPGLGSPRVAITSSPGRSFPTMQGYTDHTLTLGEL